MELDMGSRMEAHGMNMMMRDEHDGDGGNMLR